LVVRAGKLYTVSGGVMENGMILVENGKIARVGRSLPVPAGTRVLEAPVVIPGLVDMHTHVGVYSLPQVAENSDGNESTDPITPQVRALDSYNFDDPAIAVGRAGGVTTIISRPGSANIIGGTSVAVKLKYGPPEEVVIREIADLKMAIEGNPVGAYGGKGQMPTTLMGVYYLAEKAFLEAQEYQRSWDAYEADKAAGKSPTPPARDLGKDVLVMAMKGEIPTHIHVATASEIMSAIRLADQFHLHLSLCHSYYAHLLVDALQDRKDELHVNIGPPMFFSYFDDLLTFRNNPAIMANAGYKVSLQTDALGGGQQNLRHLAILAVRYGMKEEDALRAVTLRPAEAMDLEDRIGSIEPGKDADLVLLDGEPFELLTSVEKVVIDGKVEYERPSADAAPAGSPRPTPDAPGAARRLRLPAGIGDAERIAIRGGLVYTMAGAPIEGGTVLVENGKITRVGRDVPVPRGFTVVDAAGFVVMPGLVAARSHVGLESNWRRQSHIDESSKPVVPAMEVKHAVEPHSPNFAHARELGVTTLMVTPGDREVIAGRGAVLKAAGVVVDEMIVKDRAVMMMGLGSSARREGKMPSTRMGIAALARETLLKAREYMQKQEAPDTAGAGKVSKRDLDMEALIPVLKGETPLMVHAERRDDILTAVRIADEFGLRIILDGATDAYKVVDVLKEHDIPVIVEDLLRGAGNVEDQGFDPRAPARLAAAGVRIAFRANMESSWFTPGAASPGGDLLEIASFAVRNGLDPDVALRSVTLDAARIIGMESRVGSLEPGKDADVLILTGHPFLTHSVPEAVLIDGKLVYQREPGAHLLPIRPTGGWQ
ncbi:MAG: amidohydrolase family protein, partial [Gemmatimonadetes bacterium]|nr:amidohydrolase family protein [Gemmatimonadota bacterium]